MLEVALASRPVVVLTGSRQTGKSSLLQKLLPTHTYVTLDLPTLAASAEGEPALFLRQHPPPIIIDEVQYAPKLFRHLKVEVDLQRHTFGRFVLTGSQKFSLMQGVSDSLAGRVGIEELETLCFEEARSSQHPGPVSASAAAGPDVGDAVRVEDFVLRGGFPELWANRAIQTRSYYQSYLATYLERDVRSLIRVTSLRDFERFLRIGALRSAQMLNKADWARDVGVSPTTVHDWISALEASNQAYLLEPWFSNKSRSIAKSPKFYLADTGFLCFLLGIHSLDDLLRSPHIGAIWETHVYAELRKQLRHGSHPGPLWYWRDRGLEVDFLIHTGGTFQLLEAKWTEQPTTRDADAMRQVRAKLGNVTSMSVLSRTAHGYPLGDDARALAVTDSWIAK